MKNKLHYSFLMAVTIIGLLLLLSNVGEFSFAGIEFRRIRLLSDLQPDMPDTLTARVDSATATLEKTITDSVQASQDSIMQQVTGACPPGLTCIEDYSEQQDALFYFTAALAKTRKRGTTLRIAFYGDSFIEGDVFCGSLRDTLQSIFGGRGVGFVPMTSNVTGFRNTIRHTFRNWESSSLVARTLDVEIGPAGSTFVPLGDNSVAFRPSRQRYLREFHDIRLFYKNLDSAVLHFRLDTLNSSERLVMSEKVQEWRHRRRGTRRVEFTFDPYDSLYIYGASFESPGGVYVDNFSLRGNSGLNLGRISREMYRQFNAYRDYKLVILQFGLNLVVEEDLNYEAYIKRMVRVIANMRKALPNASFIMLSVSDRSENVDGEYRTMPAIAVMRDAQRLIAQESGIAFWDMFAAMGGENSMVRFVNAKPALGARDFTHLTFRGGRKLSGNLAKALLFELSKYDERSESIQ